MTHLFMALLLFSAVFLILLVLIQRGKGGGLAGAFGGLGGQSAFGTKAGDTFTRITIGVAAAWILLCILSVRLLGTKENLLQLGEGSTPVQGSSAPPAAGEGDALGGQSGAPGDEADTPTSSADAPADNADDGGS